MLISAVGPQAMTSIAKPPSVVSFQANQEVQAVEPERISKSNLNEYKYLAKFIPTNNVKVEFSNLGLNKKELVEKYQPQMDKTIEDVSSRAGKEGQFLNWIGVLPKTQIENLDKIYYKALQAKIDGSDKLAIIGIGGSRHTTEAMSKLMNVDDKLTFYSSLDSESFNRFINKVDLKHTKFLVVSKSGTTLETMQGYKNARKFVESKLGKQDAKNKFIVMTDKAEKSDLRKQVNQGEIKVSGLVHDDVGGRFSIFDDATLFSMAFAGVPKKDLQEMLTSSLKAQRKYMSTNLDKNPAALQAMYNVEAFKQGKNRNSSNYFGKPFEGIQLWEKQLKNESLKDNIATDTNVGPAYLHYNAESDFAPNRKGSTNDPVYYTFTYASTKNDPKMNAYLKGVLKTYDKQMGRTVSTVEVKDFSPKSIAEFIEFKHFETLYTGNLLRRLSGDITSAEKAMPEVLQPNVETYKINVKQEMKKLK